MPARTSLLLQPNRPLRLDAARHAELRVESGTVWITAGGAVGDLFLAAGGSYRVPCEGKVLVEAVRGMAEVRLVTCRRRTILVLIERCRAMLPKAWRRPDRRVAGADSSSGESNSNPNPLAIAYSNRSAT